MSILPISPRLSSCRGSKENLRRKATVAGVQFFTDSNNRPRSDLTMKRDMGLIREILLWVEKETGSPGRNYLFYPNGGEPSFEGYSSDDVTGHFMLLQERGLIDARFGADLHMVIAGPGLSWEGYDFLEAVRDPEVWQKTQVGMKKMGSWTFDIVTSLAKSYIKQLAKERLGIEL